VDGITRFEGLSRFMGKQVRKVRLGHVTRAEAWQAVVAFNATWIIPSWEETRLRREFEALELVDRRNHRRPRDAAADDMDRTEDGLARRLADEHAGEWRYVAGRRWLAWTGSCWLPDENNRILETCRRLCEDAAAGQAPSDRRRLLSDRTIRAVERLARSDPRLAAGAAEWDSDGMLLSTPAGVIDLRTGEVLPSDPRLQLTRISRASLGSGCPRWLAFLVRITGGDVEMAAYLQRIAGYCLTGRTDEQVFFFLHGSGANGKTVLLEMLADVLGSYARTAPLDTFMATRADRQQNDLAGLDGARMVIATETEAGRPWAEARIKAITGGERLAVRRLYGEFFETVPGYKLLIAGNHRPRLTGGGSSMARRLHLVPFDTVIPEHERDGRSARS
jgi:P4 family phage/plasmid primase-like protien